MAVDETKIGQATISLGQTTKKAAAAKAPKVLAVQTVDKTGKVIDPNKKGAAATEKERKKGQHDKEMLGAMKGMAKAQRDSKGRFQKKDKETGTAMQRLAKAFIGGALMLLIPAVIGFLNSKAWTNIKNFFVDKFIPWMKMLWTDFGLPLMGFLKSVGLEFFDKLLASWENIKELFKGVTKGFKKLFDGDIIGGLKDIFGSISTFVMKQIDLGWTFLYNTIAKIFGLEETDSVFGSISGFFTSMYHDVVNWITLTLIKTQIAISTAWTDIKTSVMGVFNNIKDWVANIFSFASDTAVEGWTNLKTKVLEVWGKVKSWFIALFTWAETEDSKDSFVVKTVKKVVKDVKEWLGGLFKFESTDEIIASAFNLALWFPNLVFKGVTAVGTWLLGLFGFDKEAEKVANAGKFNMGAMITKGLKSIGEWLWKGDGSGALEFDMSGMKDLLPDWILNPKKFFSGMIDKLTDWIPNPFADSPKEKQKKEEARKEAIESAKKALAEMEERRDLATKALKSYDEKRSRQILKHGEVKGSLRYTSKPERRYEKMQTQSQREIDKLKKIIANAETKQAGGRYKAGQPFFAGEGGQLELIVPDRAGMVMSAEKTQAMMQENIRKSVDRMGGGGGGSPVVISNAGGNVTNATTTNYIQSGVSVRRPIILNAPTTTMG